MYIQSIEMAHLKAKNQKLTNHSILRKHHLHQVSKIDAIFVSNDTDSPEIFPAETQASTGSDAPKSPILPKLEQTPKTAAAPLGTGIFGIYNDIFSTFLYFLQRSFL